MRSSRKNLVTILLVFLFVLASSFSAKVLGEEINPTTVLERRAQLEEELASLEQQMKGYENVIEEKQREATTLERDMAILNARIEKARLAIRARDLTIRKLASAIDERSELIEELLDKLSREKASLAELLRKVNELDSTSLIEIILGYESLSDFFVEADSFDTVQEALQASFANIRTTKTSTEGEREDLRQRKQEESELRSIQILERGRLEEAEAEKKKILNLTKGQEQIYQKILAGKKKDAAAIRSELFLLVGSPDIPFEKAVEYASFAWRKTGVRPAFLLGVIAEESNLGKNVGTGNWKEDLSDSRCAKQREAFQQITSELGFDPDKMPVSRRAWYGYCGGAMGPAQFMPTTWQLYKSKVAELSGHNPPNPWNPLDAFIAAALLLKDNGAAEGTYFAERRAALRYLAGSNWEKSSYSFYGDDVMALAAKYQEQINILQGLAKL